MKIAHESTLPNLHGDVIEFTHYLNLPGLSRYEHGSDLARRLVHSIDAIQPYRNPSFVVHVLAHGWLSDSQETCSLLLSHPVLIHKSANNHRTDRRNDRL